MKNFLPLILTGAIAISMSFLLDANKSERKLYAPPPLVLKYFTFGYNNTSADSYWIRLLQDFGVCEQKRGGSPIDPETGARRGKNRTPECSLGWGYHMLNLITDLAPRFYVAAVNGPLILSVVADDIDGATLLYEKAIRLFPNDWGAHYYAGSHFLNEVEDSQRAIDLFKRAYSLGAPSWLPLLIARLQTREGRRDIAKSILLEFIKNAENNEHLKERAREKLKEIE